MARQNMAGRNTRRPSRLAEVAYVRYRRWDSRYNTGGAILFRPHEFVIQTSCICASSVFASVLLHMILRCESLHPILVIKKQNQVASYGLRIEHLYLPFYVYFLLRANLI